MLVSPYSWLEEYTPQARWLGGCVRGGDSVHSAPELKTAMVRRRAPPQCPRRNLHSRASIVPCGAAQGALGFSLLEDSEMPFLIREHGAHSFACTAAPRTRCRADAWAPAARKFQWGCSHVTVWQRGEE